MLAKADQTELTRACREQQLIFRWMKLNFVDVPAVA